MKVEQRRRQDFASLLLKDVLEVCKTQPRGMPHSLCPVHLEHLQNLAQIEEWGKIEEKQEQLAYAITPRGCAGNSAFFCLLKLMIKY
jgi:hypothetical protein